MGKGSGASYLLAVGLLSTTIVAGLILSSTTIYADDTIDVVSVSIPVSCGIESNIESGEEHTATVNLGTYEHEIGITTFKVFCNDNSGFSIYAVGYSNNEYGNNKLLATIGGNLNPTYDIVTGTATSGNTSNWAMKLNKVTGTYAPTITGEDQADTDDFTNYHSVPDTYTKVATFLSNTDTTIGSSIQSTYAVYISPTQAAGTYNGKVKYTLVHPNDEVPAQPQACAAKKICYFPNASSGVTHAMGNQSVDSSDTSAVLWISNYKRPGYGFAGWSDKFDWVLGSNDANGNGTGANVGYHIYGPNQTIEFTAGQYRTNGLSLYAVWVPSAGNLQGWNGCSSLVQGAITALTDQRDNNTYAVAKLADGKCWMIENLRLDHTNLDNAYGALAQGYGGQFIGLANPEIDNFNSDELVAANSLYKSDDSGDIRGLNGAVQTDIGTTNSPENRMPRFRNDNTNSDSTVNPNVTIDTMTSRSQNIYSRGNHYTWSAAKANTSYLETIASSNAAATSICPKGWRLPRGGDKANESTNDFWLLIVDGLNNGINPIDYENSDQPHYAEAEEVEPVNKILRAFPNNFIFAGHVVGDRIYSRETGYYWTGTAAGEGWAAYILRFDDETVYPGDYISDKHEGKSVRCIIGN